MEFVSSKASSILAAYGNIKARLTPVDSVGLGTSRRRSKRGLWAQSFLARVERGEKLIEDVSILSILQTASTLVPGKSKVRPYALDGIFVFVYDDHLRPVGKTFDHPPRLTIASYHSLRCLVYYARNIGSMMAHPRPRSFNISFITQALPLGRKIFVDPVDHRWECLASEDVQEICTALKEKQPLLSLLFSDNTGNTVHSMDDILAYVSDPFISWPSLIDLELKTTNLLHIPSEQYTNNDTNTISSDVPATPITHLVQRILEATRPGANLDATHEGLYKQEGLTDIMRLRTTEQVLYRHPSLPFLWLAFYVSMRHEYARNMLITGGLIDNLWDLYFLDFPDPRLEVNHNSPPKRYGNLDIVRLCNMLLRILFPHGQSNAHERVLLSATKESVDATHPNRTWLRARDLAESLKEFLAEDLRLHRRALCARYHDDEVVLRKAMVMEERNREILKGVLR